MSIRYVDPTATGSGNGTSWANAWTSLAAITGLSGDDVVYISGGASGGSQTYNLSAYWTPSGGTSGHRITYQIGQDSSHNGTAIFHYSGATPNSDPWISGSSYINVIGDAGDGLLHFKLTGYNLAWTNVSNVRMAYIDGAAGLGTTDGPGASIASATGCELDHLNFLITNLSASSAITCSFTGSAVTDNLIHDNIFSVPYGITAGIGSKGMLINGNGWSCYNNTVTGYLAAYIGGQHADGLYCGGDSSHVKIYGNTFGDMGNYGVFGEAYAGNYVDWQVYDNVMWLTVSAMQSGSPGGIIIGVSKRLPLERLPRFSPTSSSRTMSSPTTVQPELPSLSTTSPARRRRSLGAW